MAQPDFVFSKSSDGLSYLLTKYNGAATEVTVPSSYQTLPVSGIGPDAFQSRQDITQVVLPSSLKTIGANAFGNCESLKTIALPDGLTTISGMAFASCSSLESMIVPDSVTTMGDAVFQECTALRSLTLSKNVTDLGYGFCYGDSSLETIDLRPVKAIYKAAFILCTSLTEVTFGDSLESLGECAFAGDYNLGNVTLPATLRALERGCFAQCVSMSAFTLGASNTILLSADGRYLSDNFGKLVAVASSGADYLRVPEGTKTIGDWAIYGCNGIKGVILPQSVVTVEIQGIWALEEGVYAYTYMTPKAWEDGASEFANVAFYSATEPTEHAHSYWYYDADGKTPRLWIFNPQS